jgi:hypothetical protein
LLYSTKTMQLKHGHPNYEFCTVTRVTRVSLWFARTSDDQLTDLFRTMVIKTERAKSACDYSKLCVYLKLESLAGPHIMVVEQS